MRSKTGFGETKLRLIFIKCILSRNEHRLPFRIILKCYSPCTEMIEHSLLRTKSFMTNGKVF